MDIRIWLTIGIVSFIIIYYVLKCKEKQEFLLNQIITNTTKKRFKHFPPLPTHLLNTIQEYDNQPQNIKTYVLCPYYAEPAVLARPYGNYIIRLFKNCITVFDWTQNSETCHFEHNTNYEFFYFEILNQVQTKNGQLLLYNMITKNANLIFQESDDKNFTFTILPHGKILLLTIYETIILDSSGAFNKHVFSAVSFIAFPLKLTPCGILLKLCCFRQCFELKNGYIFEVYDLRTKLFLVILCDVEKASWKLYSQSTDMMELERNAITLDFDFKIRNNTTWKHRTCENETIIVDPNPKMNKSSQIFINNQPSKYWFCDEDRTFHFDLNFRGCTVFA